jgi:phospho-N-acetylmuramoyl-pentapeptide-transferase
VSPLALIAIPFLVAFFIVLAAGKPVIAKLAKLKQPISGDAPTAHLEKQGTPTMGGLLILGAVGLTVIGLAIGFSAGGYLLSDRRARLLAVLATFLFGGLIGLMDDLGKVRKKQNKAGLSERAKLACQVLVSAGFVAFLAMGHRPETTQIFIAGHGLNLGVVYYLLAVLFICFFGNAVNFTDGLDGLSSGTTLVTATTLGAVVGTVAPEIGFFYGAVAGACAGFLWFNMKPAKVFMGDTGSLALGMGLAAGALAAKQEILLLLVGAVYVAEIGSMMIQRYVFKYRRIKHGIEYAKAHRVFRRAPLHHHFEELAVPETQVVARFWLVALIFAALGLLIAPALVPVLAQPVISSPQGAPP